MDLRLQGKIALVTGAGGAIGSAISAKLIEEGCVVHVGDLNVEAARATARSLGANARAVRMDVTRADEVQECIHRIVAQDGALDILVNNAGILKTASLVDSSIEDWDEVCKANPRAVTRDLAQAPAGRCRRRRECSRISRLGCRCVHHGRHAPR